jgi:hypothetical protein
MPKRDLSPYSTPVCTAYHHSFLGIPPRLYRPFALCPRLLVSTQRKSPSKTKNSQKNLHVPHVNWLGLIVESSQSVVQGCSVPRVNLVLGKGVLIGVFLRIPLGTIVKKRVINAAAKSSPDTAMEAIFLHIPHAEEP